ncbi:unnamed protein product [Trichobilharzia regenti]|nr:unnamed protein product [Trichobilharzia regenti]
MDIIGSSRYKAPLNTYATRIERINDIRLEKLARVKVVEKEKDELESVRNEAIAYLRLVNQLVRLKNILYQQKLSKENNSAKIAKEKLTEVQREADLEDPLSRPRVWEPGPKGLGKLFHHRRDWDRGLQLFPVNEEFLVSASHKLALITSLPFVHTVATTD